MSRLTWYVHRLRAMSSGEVLHRVGDRFRLLSQKGYLRKMAQVDIGHENEHFPRLPEPSTAPEALRAQLQADAKKLLLGEWQLYGWKEVAVGAPPCWHRDPACGVVISPDTPAHQLDYRHLPDGADARTIWEINRWVEMTRLAMHGWINDEVETIRTAQLWLEDWCDRNPSGVGINWTSALEVALRLINFTWIDALVHAWAQSTTSPRSASLREHQKALAKRIVPVHAGWVWRHRSPGSSANNHLLGELAALVVCLSRWPGLEKAISSAEQVWNTLGAEILKQFAEDGGSHEQALHYHVFAFELAWQAARAVGCKAGPVYDRLVAAARFYLALGHGKEPWDFGDSDDAVILPLALTRLQAAEELRTWLIGEPGTLRWWLGSPPLPLSPGAGLSLSPSQDWLAFPQSGYAVMRFQGWLVRLDASPLGYGSLAAHGHGDALQLSVWDGDLALLIDPGTGGYHGFMGIRTELAAWAAHNGPLPCPGGYQTPRRLGPFLQVQHHGEPKLIVEGSAALARFQHEGFSFQRQVRRQGSTIEIRDTEDYRKPFSVTFTLPPGTLVKPSPQGPQAGLIISRGQHSWRLSFTSPEAGFYLEEKRVSPAYGRIETAPVVVIRQIQSGLVTTLERL